MTPVNEINELFNNQVLELRRGSIVLAILSTLQTRLYGYSLLQELEKSGIAVDAGTLYPLLRRLEKQGVLESIWDTSDTRPRKYYELSSKGKELYSKLTEEWMSQSSKLGKLIKKTK